MIEQKAVKVMGKIETKPGIAYKFVVIHKVGCILIEQEGLVPVMVPEKRIGQGSPDLPDFDFVLGPAYG